MYRSALALAAGIALGLAGCAGDSNADSAELLNTRDTQPATSETTATSPAPAPAPAATPRAAAPAPASKPKAPVKASLPQGTTLSIRMATTLDSGTSNAGDRFQAEVVTPVSVNGALVVPAGSIVHGVVSDVHKAKRGAGHGSLALQFDKLQTPDGQQVPMQASLYQETGGKKKRNAAIIGGSAAGGAILGRVLGDDSKDAAVGALVGGAIATGVVLSKEGDQVEVPAGTEFTIALDAPIEVSYRPEVS